MHEVLVGWPWLSLAFAVLFLAWWFLRRRGTLPFRSRFTEPSWLLWLPLPVYMLHQFEEHGVDLFGRHYHFQTDLCTALGYANVADCPATEVFICAVNVGTVWIAGLVAGVLGPRRPIAAAGMIGLLAVNVVAHLGPFVRNGGAYNSGLLSAVVLFLPVVVWLFRALLARGFFRRRDVLLGVAVGFLMHAVLLGSVTLADKGLLSSSALVAIQIVNGFVPLGISFLLERQPPSEARPESISSLTARR